MKKIATLVFVILGILTAGWLHAQAKPAGYPFDVKIGGQAAVLIKDWFARIPNPVSADAVIEAVGLTVTDTMFINIYKSDSEANAEQTNAAIIMVNGTNKAKMNQTVSKQPLVAGTYLANIQVGSETSRVVFTVK
jgi:hypothetical protein